MIPVRVYVKDFLCHAEQAFEFDGHPVWLLHGPNGVGKSAVFDAMVYALFDEADRREGCGTRVADLIRYGASSMRVEFDFEYRGRRYRVWRTRSRAGQPRQGVGEFVAGEPTPKPVRDVNGTKELAAWVRATLGLTYDAFVSAVLLRQGAAERLIDADRNARRDLFRGIIDIEPYVKLHLAVTDARTEWNREVRRLRAALDQQPDVTDEQVASAVAAADRASAGCDAARAALAAAQARFAAARVWDALEANRQAIGRQLAAARDRAGRADELEAAVVRLRELRALVPSLARAADLRAAVAVAETTHRSLADRRAQAAAQLDAATTAAAAERDRAAAQRQRAATVRDEIAAVRVQHGRLADQIRQADQAVDLHQQLRTAEATLRDLPADLDEQFNRAEVAVAEAQASREALPHLAALVACRANYAETAADARAAGDDEQALSASMERLRVEAANAARHAAEASARAEDARREVALAEARHTQARDRLNRFGTVAGAPVCPECGQEIDAARASRKLADLERAVDDEGRQLASLRAAAGAASADADAASQAARDGSAELARTEVERGEAAGRRDRAVNRTREVETRFAAALAELPAATAVRVGSIELPGFPAEADAGTARELGRHHQARAQARDSLRDQRQRYQKTVQSIATLTLAVRAVGAPPDVAAARTEHADCAARLVSLDAQRDEADRAVGDAEGAERDHVERARAATAEVGQLTGEVGGAREAELAARRAYTAAVGELPPGALDQDATALRAELDRLDAVGVEREYDALAEDRALRTQREQQLAELDAQVADRVPADARRPAAEVATEVATAASAADAADRARDAARQAHADLTAQRERRTALRAELAEAERQHTLHDRLADHLGAEGIQLDLVRHAEWRVIELANDTLGRVSRDELRFEPPDPLATQALDLRVRRRGCVDPIPVGNLSGGQRCRVAVALALAVCRFACGEAQLLESVVIDEAFASLDRDGRMAMIDVIRDGEVAGGVLRRIIVVSHHEDVSAAFPVGYRLENAGGTTAVTRL